MKRNTLAAIGSALVLSVLAAAPTGIAFAQAQGGGVPAAAPRPESPNPQQFEQAKARLLQHMDARIQALQKAQSCVQGATNREQLRDCRKQEQESMRSMRRAHGGAGDGMRGPGPGPR